MQLRFESVGNSIGTGLASGILIAFLNGLIAGFFASGQYITAIQFHKFVIGVVLAYSLLFGIASFIHVFTTLGKKFQLFYPISGIVMLGTTLLLRSIGSGIEYIDCGGQCEDTVPPLFVQDQATGIVAIILAIIYAIFFVLFILRNPPTPQKHIAESKRKSDLKILISVIIIGLVSIIGLVIGLQIHNKQSSREAALSGSDSTSQPVSQVKATDTSKTFTYAYPSNWAVQKYVWSDCCEGPAKTEPDWTKQPQPITLKGRRNIAETAVHITGDNTGAVTIDSEYTKRTIDRFNTYTKTTVNGYNAIYHVTNFVGPGNAETYKDYEYVVVNGKNSVRLQFRERYKNSTLNGQNDYDASELTPQFMSIAHSIKFLR